MGVDVTHLVLVALGDTDDQVVDEGADGAECSDALARAVVELDLDEVLLGVGEGDSQVTEGLGELATGACRVLVNASQRACSAITTHLQQQRSWS